MLHFHQELIGRMQKIPQEKRYLVTSHDAFAYFTRAYLALETEKQSEAWRKRFAAPEGLAPEGQLGIADLQKIVDYLREYRVNVVFPESNVSKDSLQKIVLACREKNQNIHFSPKPLYGDSMGAKGTPSGSYLGMIEHNARILMEEWE
jgi:manganese/zinc/iron transport system substrate-binding protein